MWLTPFASVFENDTLVGTPTRNFTGSAEDILTLFKTVAAAPVAAELYEDIVSFQYFDDPGVPVHCVYGKHIHKL